MARLRTQTVVMPKSSFANFVANINKMFKRTTSPLTGETVQPSLTPTTLVALNAFDLTGRFDGESGITINTGNDVKKVYQFIADRASKEPGVKVEYVENGNLMFLSAEGIDGSGALQRLMVQLTVNNLNAQVIGIMAQTTTSSSGGGGTPKPIPPSPISIAIYGYVYTGAMKPIYGAKVIVEFPSGNKVYAVSDASGHFTVSSSDVPGDTKIDAVYGGIVTTTIVKTTVSGTYSAVCRI